MMPTPRPKIPTKLNKNLVSPVESWMIAMICVNPHKIMRNIAFLSNILWYSVPSWNTLKYSLSRNMMAIIIRFKTIKSRIKNSCNSRDAAANIQYEKVKNVLYRNKNFGPFCLVLIVYMPENIAIMAVNIPNAKNPVEMSKGYIS